METEAICSPYQQYDRLIIRSELKRVSSILQFLERMELLNAATSFLIISVFCSVCLEYKYLLHLCI